MDNLKDLIIETLKSDFGVAVEGIGPETTFDDVAVDSLLIVELALLLRRRLGVDLDETELRSHYTIAEAAELLATKGVTV